ncbi:MAG: hypothetical protein ACI909_001437 [Planctomycetota bacterium]|jgi:hypothetical protein
MAITELFCWKCSQSLEDVLLPFSRFSRCKSCKVDLHVCRMCEFFDPKVNNSCREPIAENVSDKKRANFCGYFQAANHSQRDGSTEVTSNKESLEGLFGLDKGTSNLSTGDSDRSKQELDALFGLNDKKQD